MAHITTDAPTIKCELCGMELEILTSSHLRHKHGISLTEYQIQYPHTPTVTRKYSENRAAKISEAKKGKPAHNKGVPASDTQKMKQSATMRAKYSTGDIIHWNSGGTVSLETREKISTTLKSADIDPESIAVANAKRLEKLRDRQASGWVSPLKGSKLDGDALVRSRETIQLAMRKKSEITDTNINNKCVEYGLTIVSPRDIDGFMTFQCNKCTNTFTYHYQIFRKSKSIAERVCPTCYPRQTGSSLGEQQLATFIESLGVEVIRNDRSILGFGQEIDVLIPSHKLAIEYDGLYWHSEDVHSLPKNISGKTKKLEALGYRVIHVFEDEWINNSDIVKSRIAHILGINNTRKLYARNTHIRDISSSVRDEFLTTNHIQGTDVSRIRYGAFFGDELVAVMTFKPTNFTKGGDGSVMELSRFAVLINTSIVGMASKFLKHFQRANPTITSLVSYSDRRWSVGGVYRALGFVHSHASKPNYWYFKPNVVTRLHRSNFMKHMLIADGFDENSTEFEIMHSRGFYRIYDAGNDVWELSLEK